jgi:homeobox-leucine zipper protein
MKPSGFLIRPCDGGGSILHIVDHVDLDAWSVPEVMRPLYESSKILAQKMTVAVSSNTFIQTVYDLNDLVCCNVS